MTLGPTPHDIHARPTEVFLLSPTSSLVIIILGEEYLVRHSADTSIGADHVRRFVGMDFKY